MIERPLARRAMLGGLSLGALAVALPGCASLPGFSFVDAVERLLFLSSERAFARMLQADGYWDRQVEQVGLEGLLGARGGVLARILTSTLFKDRLYDAFGDIAYEGARRAAPLVTETVRTIGVDNAIDLVRGGPRAATGFLRGELGEALVTAMVPELGTAMRVARDPLVAETLAALTGVNIGQVAERVARGIDDTIWSEIGREEEAIRADPGATRDPLIIGVFGAGSRL